GGLRFEAFLLPVVSQIEVRLGFGALERCHLFLHDAVRFLLPRLLLPTPHALREELLGELDQEASSVCGETGVVEQRSNESGFREETRLVRDQGVLGTTCYRPCEEQECLVSGRPGADDLLQDERIARFAGDKVEFLRSGASRPDESRELVRRDLLQRGASHGGEI
ncbi:MAG TPA: hypothetical protein VKS03_06550, partial [Thermoanaerobaculia bacterium]|nr:hypothetical protein [Thermoanaerobaculia bacterium]